MSDDGRKTSVTVRIAGEEHVIRASAEPEYTRACARFVDERILEVRRQSGLIESHKAAILAAMAIADQYFRARDSLEELEEEVASRAGSLVNRIEGALEDGESGSRAGKGAGASG